jgi:hypothetical protein
MGEGWGGGAVAGSGCVRGILVFRACFVRLFHGFIRLLGGFFISARYA